MRYTNSTSSTSLLHQLPMRYIIASIGFLVLVSCASHRIIDKPIVFDEERKELTIEYLSEHYGIHNNTIEIVPKMIVLHWTAIPTFEGSFDAFNAPVITGWRKYVQNASGLNVSAHFWWTRMGQFTG